MVWPAGTLIWKVWNAPAEDDLDKICSFRIVTAALDVEHSAEIMNNETLIRAPISSSLVTMVQDSAFRVPSAKKPECDLQLVF